MRVLGTRETSWRKLRAILEANAQGRIEYIELDTGSCTATARFASAAAAARAVSLCQQGYPGFPEGKWDAIEYRQEVATRNDVRTGMAARSASKTPLLVWRKVERGECQPSREVCPEELPPGRPVRALGIPEVAPEQFGVDEAVFTIEEAVGTVSNLVFEDGASSSTRTPPTSDSESGSSSGDSLEGRSTNTSSLRAQVPIRVKPAEEFRPGKQRVTSLTVKQKVQTAKAFRVQLRAAGRRCSFWRQREREAAQQTERVMGACTSALAEVEAAVQKLAAEANVQVVMEEKVDSVSQCRTSNIVTCLTDILDFVQRAHKAKEVLEQTLRCPITHDVFQKPVFAPDGQVYEEQPIRTWLRLQEVSPLTREPMRPSELLPDRVVAEAAEAWWLLSGEERPPVMEVQAAEPNEAENSLGGVPDVNEVLSEVTGVTAQPSLLHAILSGDEVTALDLLQQPGPVEGLNERSGDEGILEGASVLHLALLHGLPTVAAAIVAHPEFQVSGARMGRQAGVTALHLAASLGLVDLSQALLQRCGASAAGRLVCSNVTLHLNPGGRELHLSRHQNALTIAMSRGHREIVTLIRAAVELHLRQ